MGNAYSASHDAGGVSVSRGWRSSGRWRPPPGAGRSHGSRGPVLKRESSVSNDFHGYFQSVSLHPGAGGRGLGPNDVVGYALR